MFSSEQQSVVLCYVIVYGLSQTCAAVDPPGFELHKHLFTSHNRYVRPVANQSEAVSLKLNMNLLSVDAVDMKHQTIKVRLFFEIQWIDAYLRWNSSSFGGIVNVAVESRKLWLPNLVIGIGFGSLTFLDKHMTGRAIISSDGTVDSWPYVYTDIGCQISLTKYPFDTQSCVLDISSWTDPTTEFHMEFMQPEFPMKYYQPSGEWALVDPGVSSVVTTFKGKEYQHLLYTFSLRRKWLYYIMNVLLPVALTACLNVVCYLVPVESGEKITLAISTFLSMAVFLTMVNSALPQTADSLSVFVVSICLQLLASAVTVLLSVVTLRWYSRAGVCRCPAPVVAVVLWLSRRPGMSLPPPSPPTTGTLDKPGVSVVTGSTADNHTEHVRREKRESTWLNSYISWRQMSQALDKLGLFISLIFNLILCVIFVGVLVT